MIDWKQIQTKLGVTSDGVPGPKTFAALYAYAAQRSADAAIILRGKMAAQRFADFDMATAPRIAEFIAQCCNETGGFTRFEENLHYRADVLVSQWPSHFTQAQANAAVGNPVEIASRAYGGRMGNAGYPSKDGWTYRGRGDLQLTGKDAYRHFGTLLSIDLIGNPDLAAGDAAPLIALEYFKLNNVNAAVDAGDFTKARRLTNGGTIGLQEVARIRMRLLEVLS